MTSQSIWETEHRNWPKASSEFVFLATAFNEVGKALHPDWTGNEALPISWPVAEAQRKLERLLRAPPVTPQFKARGSALKTRQVSWTALTEEERAAVKRKQLELIEVERLTNEAILSRRNGAVDWIAERARNGELDTFGLWHGWGLEPVHLGPSIWNVANDWSLFSSCAVNRWLPGMKGPSRYYLFLTRDSLDVALGTKVAPKHTAKAENDALMWLQKEVTKHDPKTTAKAIFSERARSAFPRLSKRGFERIWGIVTSAHPEWRGPGRKSLRS